MDRTSKDKVAAFETKWKANGNRLAVEDLRDVPWPLYHLYPSSVRSASHCLKDLADIVDTLNDRQAVYEEVLATISGFAHSLQASQDLTNAITFIRLEHKMEQLNPSKFVPQRLLDKLKKE